MEDTTQFEEFVENLSDCENLSSDSEREEIGDEEEDEDDNSIFKQLQKKLKSSSDDSSSSLSTSFVYSQPVATTRKSTNGSFFMCEKVNIFRKQGSSSSFPKFMIDDANSKQLFVEFSNFAVIVPNILNKIEINHLPELDIEKIDTNSTNSKCEHKFVEINEQTRSSDEGYTHMLVCEYCNMSKIAN